MTSHRRYYRIAEITIQVDSDLPITDRTFVEAIELFRVDGPGDDTVTIHHHFGLPDLRDVDLGREVYRKPPWAIYQNPDGWVYLGIVSQVEDLIIYQVAFFNPEYSSSDIYHARDEFFNNGNLGSLTLFPTDQILVAQLLASRQGCYLHSAGATLNGKGMLFVGHSEAGKSTTTRMLMQAASKKDKTLDPKLNVEILCDDRNIVRYIHGTWQVYGTWSHGDVPFVSPASAPLTAICFLEQAEENSLRLLTDSKEIVRRLLACVIKPFVNAEWWADTLSLIENMAGSVQCYLMRFDQSGEIIHSLKKID